MIGLRVWSKVKENLKYMEKLFPIWFRIKLKQIINKFFIRLKLEVPDNCKLEIIMVVVEKCLIQLI